MKKRVAKFFYLPPGGQETFCETKRHLAVAKATEILIINLRFYPSNKNGEAIIMAKPTLQMGP
jgi:hypothetical protein